MGQGKETRLAYDGPSLEHDALLANMGARIREQRARSSDASESAAKVKTLLEDTGLNSQAYSWLKSILMKLDKKDGQAKAMDVIRSLQAGLPILEAHVGGQGTGEMDLNTAPAETTTAEPISDAEVDELAKQMDEDADNVDHVDFNQGDAA